MVVESMVAWVQHRLGEPEETLGIEHLPTPVPGAGQLLIEVAATGLSFGDLLFCRGGYQEPTPLPFTPGAEFVGHVVAVGEGTSTPVGQRVIAVSANGCGGLGQFALAEEQTTFPAGNSLSDVQAAAFLIAHHTSWTALHRRAHVARGETVLVHSGAGGIGSASIQIAKAAGAKVIAVAGGAQKTEICAGLGADLVVDHTCEDFVDVVRTATVGRGVDIVIDPVNGDIFDRSRRVVAPEGRLVVVGFAGGRIADLPSNHVLLKNYSVVGVALPYFHRAAPEYAREMHQKLLALHEAGALTPLVQREVPFEEGAHAIAAVPARETWGRLVVTTGGIDLSNTV